MQSTEIGPHTRWILGRLQDSRPNRPVDANVLKALCETNGEVITDLIANPTARRLLAQFVAGNPDLTKKLELARESATGGRRSVATHFDLFLGPRHSDLLRRITEHRIGLTPYDRFAEAIGHPDLVQHGVGILTTLNKHHVDVIVQGSLASALHGAPLDPSDLDLIVDWSEDNLHRLDIAMRSIGMNRSHPADRIISYRSTFPTKTKTMVVDAVAATNLTGRGANYGSLIDRCDELVIAGLKLNVPSLHDLLAFAQQYEDQPGATHALFKNPRTSDALEITRTALREAGPIFSPWYTRPEISLDEVLQDVSNGLRMEI